MWQILEIVTEELLREMEGAKMLFLYFWLICSLFSKIIFHGIATSTQQLKFYGKLFPIGNRLGKRSKAFPEFIHLSKKHTGYETQHPSWFTSMKKASSQKKTHRIALDYCDFFLNSR